MPILEPRMWLWRVRKHNGSYYGLIENVQGDWSNGNKPHQLDLATSDDLLNWKIITRVGEEYGLNESDIFWHENGEAWMVARSAANREGSFFCSARSPYTDWEVTEMDPMVHAPVFLCQDGTSYVAGRCQPLSTGKPVFPFAGNSLGIWKVKKGLLEPVLQVPATGDCSYPGFIKDPEGRICLTYYSQHAYHMGCVEFSGATGMPDDVYFAELEL